MVAAILRPTIKQLSQKRKQPKQRQTTSLLMIPLLVVTFYFQGAAADWTALGIFILAGITDFFDGYLARSMQQQSTLGAMLDPIADKLLANAAEMLSAGSRG